MSSILKALKKVEEESPRLEVSPSLPQKIDTKRAVSKRVRGARLFNRVLSAVVVILVVGFGAWFVLGNQDLWAPKERPAPPAASKPGVEAQVASPKPDEKGATGKSERVIPREVPRKAPAAPAEKKAGIEPARKEGPPPAVSATKPAKSVGAESARRPAQEASSERAGDEARYKLEAIVWSNNTESRFAVINGQIVRAGGSVGNLSVLEIARDHVAVRSAGREWKMRFTVE